MRSHQFFTFLTIIITLLVSQISFAQRPWNKWAPEEGVKFLPDETMDSLNSGVQRLTGDHVGEVGYAWIEYTHTLSVIHMQVINGDGEFLYPENGSLIYRTEQHIENVTICPADDGSWFIAYVNPVGNEWAIFCSRIDRDGAFQWEEQEGGAIVIDGRGTSPQYTMTPDNANGFILVCQEDPANIRTDIFALHLLDDGRIDHDWDGVWVNVFGMSMENLEGEPHNGFSTISDGEGGVVVLACNRALHGNRDVFVQRISVEGEKLWNAETAVCVCENESAQSTPAVCSDGEGGVFVVWIDSRNIGDNGEDLYAQRIDGDGNLMWDADGEVLCGNEHDQSRFAVALLEPGVMAVIWADTWFTIEEQNQVLTGNVYVNLFSGDHSLRSEWQYNPGKCVGEDYNNIQDVCIKAREGLGIVVAWSYEMNFQSIELFTQKLSRNGIREWDRSGVPISGGRNYDPDVYITPNETFIYDWYYEWLLGRICQHLNTEGEKILPANGKPVILDYDQNEDGGLLLCSTDENEFAVSWIDHRLCPSRIGFARNDGNRATFPEEAIAASISSILSGGGSQRFCELDGSGGIVCAWSVRFNDGFGDNCVQRISADGERLWGENGIRIPSDASENCIGMVSDQNGGAWVFWDQYYRDEGVRRIYYQRINSDGELMLESAMPICELENIQRLQCTTLDSEGNCIVVFSVENEQEKILKTQRIDQDGVKLWSENGILICNSAGIQNNAFISPLGNSVFIAWADYRNREDNLNPIDIYGQIVNFDRSLAWREGGRGIVINDRQNILSEVFTDADNNVWIVWRERIDDRNSRYLFQKFLLDGEQPEPVFEQNKVVFNFNDNFRELQVLHDGQSGMWAVASESDDIIAVHYDTEGNHYYPWLEGGLPVCTANHIQQNPQVILAEPSGGEGIIVAWRDARDWNGWENTYQLYLQRVADDFGNGVGDGVSPYLPVELSILSPYPNPFNSVTRLRYNLPADMSIEVSVFNSLGQRVSVLDQGMRRAGSHDLIWNAENTPSGVYFVRLHTPESALESRILLIR